MEKYALSIIGVVVAFALIGFFIPNNFTGLGVYHQGNLVKTADGLSITERTRSVGLATGVERTLTVTNNLPIRTEANSDDVVVRGIRVSTQLLASHGVTIVNGKTVIPAGKSFVVITLN